MRLGTAAGAQPPASCCSSSRALAGHRLGALRAAPLRAPRVCVGVGPACCSACWGCRLMRAAQEQGHAPPAREAARAVLRLRPVRA